MIDLIILSLAAIGGLIGLIIAAIKEDIKLGFISLLLILTSLGVLIHQAGGDIKWFFILAVPMLIIRTIRMFLLISLDRDKRNIRKGINIILVLLLCTSIAEAQVIEHNIVPENLFTHEMYTPNGYSTDSNSVRLCEMIDDLFYNHLGHPFSKSYIGSRILPYDYEVHEKEKYRLISYRLINGYEVRFIIYHDQPNTIAQIFVIPDDDDYQLFKLRLISIIRNHSILHLAQTDNLNYLSAEVDAYTILYLDKNTGVIVLNYVQ